MKLSNNDENQHHQLGTWKTKVGSYRKPKNYPNFTYNYKWAINEWIWKIKYQWRYKWINWVQNFITYMINWVLII